MQLQYSTMLSTAITATLIVLALASPTVQQHHLPAASNDTIPEFFDDVENIYTLAVGLGIIVLSLIIALVIFRVRSRSLAFDNSLFQNL